MDSTILDVAIGLTFLYLIMALLCSGIQEWVTQMLDRRATFLKEGIQTLLGEHPVSRDSSGSAGSLADMVLRHGVIRSLSREGKMPSYIPARAFAVAVTESIMSAQQRGADSLSQAFLAHASARLPLRDALYAARTGQVADMQKARQAIEQWFDEGMERVTARYKRRTRAFMLLFAAMLTVAFNVDTLDVTHRLYADRGLRDAVVKNAEAFRKDPSTRAQVQPGSPAQSPDQWAKAVQTDLKQLDVFKLPIGWREWEPRPGPYSWQMAGDDARTAALKLIGWMLTALAISLGAPFWFDMLSRIGPLRAAGLPPAKAPQAPIPPAPPGGERMPPASGPSPPRLPDARPFSEAMLSYHDVVDIQKKLDVPRTGTLDDATREKIKEQQEKDGQERTGYLTADLVGKLLS